jgi:phosphorylcholine metabolism protein LicD
LLFPVCDKQTEVAIFQQTETETQPIFLDLFIVGSSCQWKFVVCPFVDKETNTSYLFATE